MDTNRRSLPALVLAFALIGCASHPTRTAPSASTAQVSASIAAAKNSTTAAKTSAGNVAGHVASALGHSDKLGSRLDTIRSDGKQILRILNGEGHP